MANHYIDEIYLRDKYSAVTIENINKNYAKYHYSLKELLFYCVYISNLDLLKHLFTIDPNLNFTTPDKKSSAIHLAMNIGNQEIVKFIKTHKNFKKNKLSKELEKMEFVNKYKFTNLSLNNTNFFTKIKNKNGYLSKILEEDNDFIKRNNITFEICLILTEDFIKKIVHYFNIITNIDKLNLEKIKILILNDKYIVNDDNILLIIKKFYYNMNNILPKITLTEKIFNYLLSCNCINNYTDFQINPDYILPETLSKVFENGNKELCKLLLKIDMNFDINIDDFIYGLEKNDVSMVVDVIRKDKNFGVKLRSSSVLGYCLMKSFELFDYILDNYVDCNKNIYFIYLHYDYLGLEHFEKIYERLPNYRIDVKLLIDLILFEDEKFTNYLLSKTKINLPKILEEINDEDVLDFVRVYSKIRPEEFLDKKFLDKAIEKNNIKLIKIFFEINKDFIIDSIIFEKIISCCDYENYEFIINLYEKNNTTIDLNNKNILKIIVDNGVAEYLEWLLEKYPGLDITIDNHYAFITSCQKNNEEMVKIIEEICPNIYFVEYGINGIIDWKIIPNIIYEVKPDIKIDICSICYEKNDLVTNCNHLFCKICMDNYLENNFTCPYCREEIKKIYIL